MHLFFWQNIISPHQAPFIRELAERGHDVVVVTTEEMSGDRRRLGWNAPSLGRVQIILGPALSQVDRLVSNSSHDTIHIIAGARGTPLGRKAALACRKSGRSMGIVTEAPDARGIGGGLRWLKYAFERITLGANFDFLMAMGETGVSWFKGCGYPGGKIFPFGYVTERLSDAPRARQSGRFRFLFVGRLISLKGLDLLVEALTTVARSELLIIGDGPEKSRLQELVQREGLEDRIHWLGQMEGAAVQAHIGAADVLVLPSRKDGWGAVINESLMVGTPVICSTACGAADLIQQPWLGTVFRKNDSSSLAAAMSHWSKQGNISEQQRTRIRDWSKCIEAPVMAGYVEEILRHVYQHASRPGVPWRK